MVVKKKAKVATKKKVVKKVAKKTEKKVTKKVVTKKEKTVKKAAAPKKAKVVKEKTKRKPNAAFMKPLTPSAELAAVVGQGPMPRTEVVKKLWAYIKKHGLQDQKNKQQINADEKLREVFDGVKSVSMFEMTRLVSKHLK